MSKWNNIMVKIHHVYDGLYLAVQTYQRNVGRSPEFWIPVAQLQDISRIVDIRVGYGEYVRLIKEQDMIYLELTWLHMSGDRVLNGRRQIVYLPAQNFKDGKWFGNAEWHDNKIVYTESAHRLISQMNSRERRAFAKWSRDYTCYHLGKNTLTVFKDWDKDFGFYEEGRWTTRGGICRHENDGKITYQMHT